jgi:hypothetical protein
MAAVIHSENAAHKAALLVAAQVLQAAEVGATQAQLKTAHIVYYRSCIASAKTNGVPFQQFSTALRELIGQET